MSDLSLVLAYYQNPVMLQKQYEVLERLVDIRPRIAERLELVVVDDGSPNNPAHAPRADFPVQTQIFRITVDVRWNQDAARNIGVHHASSEWVLLTDMDHVVPPVTWQHLIDKLDNGAFDRHCVYTFQRKTAWGRDDVLAGHVNTLTPYKPHPNSWLINTTMYELVGGYDERFAGVYGTDGDFRKRLEYVAKVVELRDEFLVRVPRDVIPDASTTAYERRTVDDGIRKKQIADQRARELNPRPKRLTFPYIKVL